MRVIYWHNNGFVTEDLLSYMMICFNFRLYSIIDIGQWSFGTVENDDSIEYPLGGRIYYARLWVPSNFASVDRKNDLMFTIEKTEDEIKPGSLLFLDDNGKPRQDAKPVFNIKLLGAMVFHGCSTRNNPPWKANWNVSQDYAVVSTEWYLYTSHLKLKLTK